MKECKGCHKILPLDMFPKDIENRDGHKGKCKECTRKYGKKYRELQKLKRLRLLGILGKEERAEFLLGGIKVYILNYAQKGEYKYNVQETNGNIYKTNNSEEFFNYLRGKI